MGRASLKKGRLARDKNKLAPNGQIKGAVESVLQGQEHVEKLGDQKEHGMFWELDLRHSLGLRMRTMQLAVRASLYSTAELCDCGRAI